MGSICDRHNWYLAIDGLQDRQTLYHVDRPTFSFPVVEEVRGGKTILKPARRPVWAIISLEIPTRPVMSTEMWINKKDKRDIILDYTNVDGQLLERWFVQNAEVVSTRIMQARSIDLKVIRMQLKYTWAYQRR